MNCYFTVWKRAPKFPFKYIISVLQHDVHKSGSWTQTRLEPLDNMTPLYVTPENQAQINLTQWLLSLKFMTVRYVIHDYTRVLKPVIKKKQWSASVRI